KSGTIFGTPSYISPEQVLGFEATTASDIYSFGIVAYELLAGATPFHGKSTSLLQEHLTATPPHPSTIRTNLATEVGDAMLTSLTKQPHKRPKKASEFVGHLQEAYSAYLFRKWREKEWPLRWKISAALTALLSILYILSANHWPFHPL